jgi:hypothetical protein
MAVQTKHTKIILAGAMATGAGMLSVFGVEGTHMKKPNVILCMTDDQGWGDTGYNGHQVAKTPHLDRMAAEGLRFDRFYSAAPIGSVVAAEPPANTP